MEFDDIEIVKNENDKDSLFIDEYTDDYITLDHAEDHYNRMENILNEFTMMNHVWTEEEIEQFNEGVARCTIHDPIGIAKYMQTKNAIQVSRRLYLIEEIMIHRDPLSHTVIPASIDGQDLDFLLKEQESADVSLENEKIRYSKRANKKKDFDIIDSSILEKRYGQSYLINYHEFQGIVSIENSLKEWLRLVIRSLISFSRQREGKKKSRNVNVSHEDVYHVLSYFGFDLMEMREKFDEKEASLSKENEEEEIPIENMDIES